MKKTILTGVALMAFAAAGFAQNTSTVNQNGNNQTVSATQVGNMLTSNIQQTSAGSITNEGNFAGTLQRNGSTGGSAGSVNNEAFINQINSKSGFANITQEGGGAGANTATINQRNNNGGSGTAVTAASAPTITAPGNTPNAAGIAAVTGAGGNYANAAQQGGKEQVTINQNDNSTGNYADSRQDNYNNGSSSQVVTINQSNTSTNNKATANQFGDQNQLNISQSNNSSSNTASVRQGFSGAQNGPNTTGATATVEQNGVLGAAGSTANIATVSQNGISSGTATIRQNAGADGVSNSNEGTISQSNNGNTGNIDQNNRSDDNAATVTQAGTNGVVGVSQSNNSGSNRTNVDQVSGVGSQVSVQQSYGAFRNQTDVTQYGDSQVASVEQVASSDNEATINQGSSSTNSSFNRARVYQKDGSQQGKVTINQNVVANGGNNFALVQQAYPVGTSTGNEATVNQEGTLNTVRLSQTGVGQNKAMIDQMGNGNIIDGPGSSLYETGPMAVQSGTNNQMTVSQTSGTNALVFNRGTISQSGTDNKLELTQTAVAAGNLSTVMQMGSTNQAIVQQTGVVNP